MTSVACDTSVLVAALLPWHDDHTACRPLLKEVTHLPAHVLVETYSVLTRLPAPHRLTGDVAAAAVAALPFAVLELPESQVRELPGRLAAAQVTGGATCDGLIAATVVRHGCRLHTRDARARRTYQRLGVDLA